MEYEDYFATFRTEAPDLAKELESVRGMEGVMAWMKRRGLPLGDVDIITQDEFSLDFVIPLTPDERHLVFGIT
jgi:hypothetical protein